MVKLPWTHFTGDRRHVEVMGLLTAWMKHDRGAQSINYPGAIFLFFFFFLKTMGVCCWQCVHCGHRASKGTAGREHAPARTGFNNVVMTPELTDGDRTHMRWSFSSSATCESDAKPLPRCPELTFRIAYPFFPAPI